MAAKTTKARQLSLALPQRGGKRRNAGRKPNGARAGVSHRERPRVSGREPVHVTLRVCRHVWGLRRKKVFRAIQQAFALQNQSDRAWLHIVEFSVQGDHVHLIVEPLDNDILSRGVQGLCVRIARALNRLMSRKGQVFADRFHAHVLRTVREVRNAVSYVLGNRAHHARQFGEPVPPGADPCSSACGEAVWAPSPDRWPWRLVPVLLCVFFPRTWLMRQAS